MPILTAPGRLQVPNPHVSDIPHSSASSIPSAWKNSSTSTGVGAAPTLTATRLVETEHLAQLREHLLVGLRRPAPRARAGPARRAGLSRTRSIAAASAACDRLARLLGLGRLHRLEPGLQLLPDPRHREEPGRADLRQVGEDLARVRAGRDRAGVDHRDVVVGHPLGDVRGREPRDQPSADLERDDLLDRLGGEHDAVVRELDALRRPGRARGVDQRQHVVRGDLPPRRRRRRSRGWSPRRRPARSCPPAARRRSRSRARGAAGPCAPRASPAGTPARRSPRATPRR